ncbi:phosphoribosylamine--glycine ligase [Vicingaceae bacterium]|nr:phosphoribosylamine--glycine ligase [Vicingaceae bacterium]
MIRFALFLDRIAPVLSIQDRKSTAIARSFQGRLSTKSKHGIMTHELAIAIDESDLEINMNVLVIGGGGREHALAWKISQSPRVSNVFVAPGNAGTAVDAQNIDISAGDIQALIQFAKNNSIGLTVVGPEAPLCSGIADAFRDEGLRVFGPSRVAAQLEGSKVFCKNLLHVADVPTADFWVFDNPSSAERFVNERFPEDKHFNEVPLVVKADGLAAGKGAIVCSKRGQVIEAIDRIARKKEFGSAGDQIVLEERLDGDEASVLAITDGRTILSLPPAQDHKRAHDGDLGPNTGGMGAYCPTPLVDAKMMSWVEERVLVPTVHAMKRARCKFQGVLYAGLMLTPHGPKVLEYNVRFGDPECQPVLMRLKSDLVDILEATVDGTLDQIGQIEWDDRTSVCVVMASEGYPGSYSKGHEIRGLEAAGQVEDVKVFHAGTAMDGDRVVTTGGRVLGITAIGDSVSSAKLQAYKAVRCIRWDGAWCRKDISDKGLVLQQ